MTRVKVRLPLHDEHIPHDKQMPDLTGLPVRVNYEGDPIGRVIGCEDQGDGTALAELEVELPPHLLKDVCYGLDGRVAMRVVDGEQLVESLRAHGVGVWAPGDRPTDGFPHFHDGD